LRFKIPLIDKVKKVSDIWGKETNKDDFFIELTEQITDTSPREYFTKDNVKVTSDCVMRWRIVDPVKAIYEVDNLHRSIKETVLNSMRGEIGSRELDNVLSAR
jgi:regulator of protease activity HflC (stomatin/prohibitin superfamily)